MERVNARTMEIYRRMGLAKKVRAAGLRRDVPMDVYIVLDLTRPPLLRLPYPSVAEAEADIRATTDGTAPLEPYQLISQYTLEPLLKTEAEALPSVTMRWSTEYLSHEQDADGVTHDRPERRWQDRDRSAPTIWSAATAAPARCARRSASSSVAKPTCCAFRQALYRCDELFDKLPIGNGPGRGRHYHVADEKASFLIMQDSTKHWTLHATVDTDEEMERQFEKIDRRSGEIRDAVLQSVAAEPAARGPLPGRPRVPGRRCGPSGHSDRRARHELRRWRRDRSRLEARRHAAGLGRAEAA